MDAVVSIFCSVFSDLKNKKFQFFNKFFFSFSSANFFTLIFPFFFVKAIILLFSQPRLTGSKLQTDTHAPRVFFILNCSCLCRKAGSVFMSLFLLLLYFFLNLSHTQRERETFGSLLLFKRGKNTPRKMKQTYIV